MTVSARILADMLDPGRTLPVLGVTPDEYQRRMLWSTAKFQLYCWGRQVGKSRTEGHVIAQETCLRDGWLTLIVSGRQEQSDELMLKTTESAAVLCDRFRRRIVASSSEKLVLDNGSRVLALPGRNPDAPRSYSANRLVMEEATFTADELFSSALYTLAKTDGVLVALSSAPRKPDGWFWRAWTQNGTYAGETAADEARDEWERSYYPSDRCPRASTAVLEMAAKLDPDRYSREVLCRFPDSDGANRRAFSREALAWITSRPADGPVERV